VIFRVTRGILRPLDPPRDRQAGCLAKLRLFYRIFPAQVPSVRRQDAGPGLHIRRSSSADGPDSKLVRPRTAPIDQRLIDQTECPVKRIGVRIAIVVWGALPPGAVARMLGPGLSSCGREHARPSHTLRAAGQHIFFDTDSRYPRASLARPVTTRRPGCRSGILPVSQVRSRAGTATGTHRASPTPRSARRSISIGHHAGDSGGPVQRGLFWDGRADTLEEQAKQPFLNPLEMHNPSAQTVVVAVRASAYADLFRQVFGPQLSMTLVRPMRRWHRR